jgi:PAS domain S-box-containing protein/putative nucleotidyltransferase with HDIG domain
MEFVSSQVAQSIERKKAADQLRASEARFASAFENAAIGMALVSPQGRWLKVNQALCDVLGYSSEELLTRSFQEITHPDDLDADLEFVRRTLAGEIQSYQTEKRYIHKQGRAIWVLLSVSLVRDDAGEPQYFISQIQDITSRKDAETQIGRQLDQLAALRTIDNAISSSLDLRLTLNVALEQTLSQLKVDAACVLLLDPATQTLRYAAGRGFRAAALQDLTFRLGEGYAGTAALERRTVRVSGISRRETDFLRAPGFKSEEFDHYVGVPLMAKGKVQGVLEVFQRSAPPPVDDWAGFLDILAGQAAIAIDNATLFNNLQRSNDDLTLAYDATIEGWSRALDLRDQETEGHTRRVADMTIRLARLFGIVDEQLVHMRRGALLHDIGKMAIPDTILHKPGPLDDAEWKLMRKHPTFARDMLAPIRYLQPALDIPWCHHEHWDGKGYPRGLEGEQIPIAARIFAVVDVWDALTSARPYRPAWTTDSASEHIRSLSGTQFDPEVVQVFVQLQEVQIAESAQRT